MVCICLERDTDKNRKVNREMKSLGKSGEEINPQCRLARTPGQSVKSVSQSVSIHTFHDGGGA